MDELIDSQCKEMQIELDLELIKRELESNPSLFTDDHMVDTLQSILDFQKFKIMILAQNKREIIDKPLNEVTKVDDMTEFRNMLLNDTKILIEINDSKEWKLTNEAKGRKA